MSKRSRKRSPATEVASSEPELNPDATLGPGASQDGTRTSWKEKDSTNAPMVGEEEPQPVYAQGYPELIDKLLRDKIPFQSRLVYIILILGWFGVGSWLLIQDNQAGLLTTSTGMIWFGWKILVFTSLAGVAALLVVLLFWITGSSKTEHQ